MYRRPELIPFNWVPGYITITLCISTLHGDSITYRSHQNITPQARINMCDLKPYITFFLVLKPVQSNHQLSACIYVHEGCCTYYWFHKCKEDGQNMTYHSISLTSFWMPHNSRFPTTRLVHQYPRKWNKRLTHRPTAIVASFWDPCINQSRKVCLHLHSSTTEEILVIHLSNSVRRGLIPLLYRWILLSSSPGDWNRLWNICDENLKPNLVDKVLKGNNSPRYSDAGTVVL